MNSSQAQARTATATSFSPSGLIGKTNEIDRVKGINRTLQQSLLCSNLHHEPRYVCIAV
jgi:hypothetical protein